MFFLKGIKSLFKLWHNAEVFKSHLYLQMELCEVWQIVPSDVSWFNIGFDLKTTNVTMKEKEVLTAPGLDREEECVE